MFSPASPYVSFLRFLAAHDLYSLTQTAQAAESAALAMAHNVSSTQFNTSGSTTLNARATPSGQTLITDLTDMSGTDSWPLTTYMYYLVRRGSSSYDCKRAQILPSLVYWAMTSSQASNLAQIDEGVHIPYLTLRLVVYHITCLLSLLLLSLQWLWPATQPKAKFSRNWQRSPATVSRPLPWPDASTRGRSAPTTAPVQAKAPARATAGARASTANPPSVPVV